MMENQTTQDTVVPAYVGDARSSPSLERLSHGEQLRRATGSPHRVSATRRFLCRLDVCWTFFYFLFLACVAVLISTVTQCIINPHILDTWHTLHYLRISAANTRIDQGASIVDRMAMAFVSMRLRKPVQLESEDTLALACSVLANYDKDAVVRAFAPGSLADGEMVACIHGMAASGSLSTMTGYVPYNHTINGTYLVDSNTMRFVRPLQKMTEQPPDRRNSTYNVEEMFALTDVLEVGEALYNGTIDDYDRRVNWMSPPSMPHLLYYTYPVSMVARRLKLNRSINDFAQVRVDGSRVLLGNSYKRTHGFSIAAFIYQSLNDTDPQLLATSWGQESVSNNSVAQSTSEYPVTYLTVSGIDDPLMRAALKHVSFRALQKADCNETTDFRFRGAPATVTALTYTTRNGCVLHLVFAGSHAALAGAYQRKREICNAMLVLAVLLFTALFWYFLRTQLSLPLRRLTHLMVYNIETGSRVMFVTGSSTWFRLKEVCRLTRAHNRVIHRLQQIEIFIPAAVRDYFNQPAAFAQYRMTDTSDLASNSMELSDVAAGHLTSRTLTAVYVTMRPAQRLYFPSQPLTQLLRNQAALASTGRAGAPQQYVPTSDDATASEHPVSNAPIVNSGPFTSPVALEAFIDAVYDLSAQHHGVVYSICPESCVIHFYNAAAAAQSTARSATGIKEVEHGGHPLQTPEAAAEMLLKNNLEAAIRRDARDALAFVWALDARLHDSNRNIEIDARMLVDTTTFVCGQYRAKSSEHCLSVALGRDVQRDIGPLLPALQVYVAMTEETARRVRAEWTGRLEPGVRQLPIDAVSMDRAGSTKNAVLLYEALRGSVAGNRVWQLYAQRCFEGFSCMLRGEYAAALAAYSRIREIADLEPGLMPTCLEREAALSFVSGGAVSTQVERLMRECRRCVAQHITRGYCRTRRVPPGVCAMRRNASAPQLAEVVVEAASPVYTTNLVTQPYSTAQLQHHPSRVASWPLPSHLARDPRASRHLQRLNMTHQRYLVTTVEPNGCEVRHVLGDPAARIRDNFGHKWALSGPFRCVKASKLDNAYVVGMRASGDLCYATQILLRQVPPIVAKAVNGAADGFLSDALRSAVPVCDPTKEQCVQLQAVVNAHCTLTHRHLILPLSFSVSVEGVVVLFYPFFAGSSLREVLRRYPRTSPLTASCFTLPALTALAYLHSRHIAHGEFTLDNVIVSPDGSSSLLTRCCGHRLAHEVFAVPRTCYVSPAMAAGAPPSLACDVFCYGLMCLEFLTGNSVWKWAPVEEGRPQRTQDELQAILLDCGKPFRDAVAQGVLVPNMDILEEVISTNLYRELTRATVRACLSFDPSQRPTAEQLCAVTKIYFRSESAAVSAG